MSCARTGIWDGHSCQTIALGSPSLFTTCARVAVSSSCRCHLSSRRHLQVYESTHDPDSCGAAGFDGLGGDSYDSSGRWRPGVVLSGEGCEGPIRLRHTTPDPEAEG